MSKRILVVDDSRDAAEAVAMLLEIEGHDVRTAHSGREALEVAGSWAPEAMILDIGLPDIDGYALAGRMRALDLAPAPLLVALSGYGSPADVQRAMGAGFDAHVLKPAEPDVLFALLAETALS